MLDRVALALDLLDHRLVPVQDDVQQVVSDERLLELLVLQQ